MSTKVRLTGSGFSLAARDREKALATLARDQVRDAPQDWVAQRYVELSQGDVIVNTSQNGGFKDTWVLDR
jgi:uncharacterized circularly permuted ATP-grasp superfamily protein